MPNAESPIVITVFGSSRPQPGSDAYETAQALGAVITHAGFKVRAWTILEKQKSYLY